LTISGPSLLDDGIDGSERRSQRSTCRPDHIPVASPRHFARHRGSATIGMAGKPVIVIEPAGASETSTSYKGNDAADTTKPVRRPMPPW